MASSFESSRLMIEARAIDLNDAPLGLKGHIPFSERIRSQPRDCFQTPKFVERTAGDDYRRNLDEVFGQVWRLNEEFVGERARVAEAALWSDAVDEALLIRERLLCWCRLYFDQRLKTWNPKDGGDPYKTFWRLGEEFGDVSSCLRFEESVGYTLFDYLQTFVVWHLYDKTFRNALERRMLHGCDADPGGSFPALHRQAIAVVRQMGYLFDPLHEILSEIRRLGDRLELESIDGLSDEAIRLELASAVSDIREMRPYLIHNYNPTKSILRLGEGLVLAWKWTVRFGVGTVIGADDEREALEDLESKSPSLMATVDYDGRLLDPCRPWSTKGVGYLEPTFGLTESLYVLRRFHERLLNFYGKIDIDAIRRRGRSTASLEGLPDDEIEQLIAVSCQDVAEQGGDRIASPAHGPSRRIARMRFGDLIRHLERAFGFMHRNGKGSEVVVCRNGSKFILGRHGRNPEVTATTVRRLLRHFGISEEEWLGSVYARG